ncbi:diiron oxygenase [Amycolatopsis sp. lyj-23]|uniref:diiron oxygenase n=1 Tax=Amycolatopsis sp. lyj-23 TaxID=2789283 RepID=UPI00397C730C
MLPEAQTPAENAVIKRLAENWSRRATVKKTGLVLEDLFEPGRPDYPIGLTPIWRHPELENIDENALNRALLLAALAFHRHSMVIEQEIVCPTFATVVGSDFSFLEDGNFESAVAQAAVDEQYHTWMHLNAAQELRRRRPWKFPLRELPVPAFVSHHRQERAVQATEWQRRLLSLAYMTVTEVSIDAYLKLVADDKIIQPLNSVTAALHWRDEMCHSSISEELAKSVFFCVGTEQKDFFMTSMIDAVRVFMAQDMSTWKRIVVLAGIRDGRRLLNECSEQPDDLRLVRDNSGVHHLWRQLNDIAGGRYNAMLDDEAVPLV